MTLHECRAEREKRVSDLLNKCRLFWAFNNEQLAEGIKKYPLQDGERHVHIGAGGYMPDSQIPVFREGMKEIDKWFEDAIQNNNLRRKLIIYELSNHEAWYTGDIEDTLAALGPNFTTEEVYAVLNEEAANQMF